MRFIGSKALLLNEIEEVIKEKVNTAQSFCDMFSGTSIVARHFKKDFKIISNDLLHFSYVLQKATIENEYYPSFTKITELIKLNTLQNMENNQCFNTDFRKFR